jgi:hypothetical protein
VEITGRTVVNPDKIESMEEFRRRFQMKKKKLRPSVLEYLKKIGDDILKIKLSNLAFNKADIVELMKIMQEIVELEISEIQFTETDPGDNFDHFKLKHLTKLNISHSTNPSFCFGLVPASLKSLNIEGHWNDKILDAELLGKQKGLEELSLIYCGIIEFKFDPENCHIKKLTIGYLEFLNDRAFEKFSEFVKLQESVTELKLSIHEEALEGRNQKNPGILTHLLSLKSLKKVTIDCEFDDQTLEVFPRLKICNPAVETLTIENPYLHLHHFRSFPKFFPNVTDLKITWPSVTFYKFHLQAFNVDLKSINSMKKIRKLEIELTSDEMLTQLKLKELRELHVTEFYSLRDYDDDDSDDDDLGHPLADWRKFINNNSQLEVLCMSECKMSVEQLQIALENLPLLKSLEFTVYGCNKALLSENPEISAAKYKKEQAEKTARLIGEKYDRLEHLKLNFEPISGIKRMILNFLGKYYPSVELHK